MTDDERSAVVETIASNPLAGDVMVGTGGCRKLRFKKPGQGKSGGYRTIHWFGGIDFPVVLLTVFGKGEKANLTNAERNSLAKLTRKAERQLLNAMEGEMKSAFDKIAAGLESAIAHARGEDNGTIVHTFVDVKAIRAKTKLTQPQFARRYQLPVASIRDWEQNRFAPPGPARTLLRMIDTDPEGVARILARAS